MGAELVRLIVGALASIRLAGALCSLISGFLILSCLWEIDWRAMRRTRAKDAVGRAPWRPAFVTARGQRRLAVALPLLACAIAAYWIHWFAK